MSTKIYAILDTSTNEFCSFNGRNSWSATNAMQSSFHASQKYQKLADKVKWKEQTQYIAVELTEYYFNMKGLEK